MPRHDFGDADASAIPIGWNVRSQLIDLRCSCSDGELTLSLPMPRATRRKNENDSAENARASCHGNGQWGTKGGSRYE